MNKIIVTFILFCCIQCKSNNKNSGTIHETANFVGKELKSIEEREKELNYVFEFIPLEKYDIDFNNDGKLDEITIEKIKDWNDPGDFHLIRLRTEEKEYLFFNSDGWVEISDYEKQYINNFSNSSLITSKYIIIQKSSDKDILLFAFGYVYASQPGLLSIFNLSRFDAPEIIFNDNFHLYSYKDENNDGTNDIMVTKNDMDELTKDTLVFNLINGSYLEHK